MFWLPTYPTRPAEKDREAGAGIPGRRAGTGRLRVQPRLPSDWPGYQAEWRLERGTLLIRVERGEADVALLDGQPVDEVALKELEGEHHLRVVIP